MPNVPDRGYAQREEVAAVLEDAGWLGPPGDVRDGVDYDVILRRLRDIGEGDSEAAHIICWGRGSDRTPNGQQSDNSNGSVG